MSDLVNPDLCNVTDLMTVRRYAWRWSNSLRRAIFVELGLDHYDLSTGERWNADAREQGVPTEADYAEMDRLASDEEQHGLR